MKIIATYGNVTPDLEKKVLFSRSALGLRKIEDGETALNAIVFVESTTGKAVYVDTGKGLYATNSASVYETLDSMCAWGEAKGLTIQTLIFTHEKTEKGREYVVCDVGEVR